MRYIVIKNGKRRETTEEVFEEIADNHPEYSRYLEGDTWYLSEPIY